LASVVSRSERTIVLMLSLSSATSPCASTEMDLVRSPVVTALVTWEEDLAARVDGDLLAEVALGHRGGDLGDVPHLAGQVVGHRVDGVGEALPAPRDGGHLGLTAELAVNADLAGHPGHLGGGRGCHPGTPIPSGA